MNTGKRAEYYRTVVRFGGRIMPLRVSCLSLLLAALHIDAADFDWRRICVSDTLTLYVKDRNVGVLMHDITFDSSGGCVRETKEVRVFGNEAGVGAMRMDEVREYSLNGGLRSAVQVLESPSGATRWRLAKKKAGEWSLSVTAGGETTEREIKGVISNLRTTYDIQTGVLDGRVRKGQIWSDTLFDLMSGRHITARTICKAAPQESGGVWVFSTLDNVINREELWELDSLGKTVLMEVAPIFTARRVAARGNDAPAAGSVNLADIAEQFIVKMDRSPGSDDFIELKLDDDTQLHVSVEQMYETRRDGWRRLRAETCECNDRRSGRSSAGDSLWLRHTTVVQTHAEKIREKSAYLSKGNKQGSCGMVRAFNDYVYRTIEKRNVATFSSALETLQAGFGDCGEHAVLLAALLRAAGIPSQVLFGLVYFSPKNAFMYHSWVRVRIGGVWLNADPALGDFPSCIHYAPLLSDDTGENGIFLANCIDRVRIRFAPSR